MAIATSTLITMAIVAAISIATSAATMYMQNQQMIAQAKHQNQVMEQTNKAMMDNYALAEESAKVETSGVQRQYQQQADQTANEQEQNAIAARQARATSVTAAGE